MTHRHQESGTLYEVLEVSPKASPEVIRAAYKSLMQRHHPDKSPDPVTAGARAAAISRAYEVLGQPEQRAAYDARLQQLQPAAAQVLQAHARSVVPVRAPSRPESGSRWYAGLLAVCILGSGGVTWRLSRKPVPPVVDPPSLPAARPVALAQGPQRMSAFVTQFSVTLAPDPQGRTHELLIPELVLRVGSDHPDRWAQDIENQRAPLLRRMLDRLSALGYDELLRPEGEQLVGHQIEAAVSEVTGLPLFEPLPPGAAGLPPRQQIEAILPQHYSLR